MSKNVFGVWMTFNKEKSGARTLQDEFETKEEADLECIKMDQKEIDWMNSKPGNVRRWHVVIEDVSCFS